MTTRLSTIAPDLSGLLEATCTPRLREVAKAAATAAITLTSLSDPRLDAGLQALRAHRFGDSVERSEVESLVGELDERQWDLRDAVDEGAVFEDDQLKAFSSARAANALWFALSSDPLEAATEAVYDANAAIGGLTAVRELIGVVP